MSGEPSLDDQIAEMLAERDIRNAIMRYVRGVNRKDWALMASVYHADATEDHGPLQGSPADLIAWVQKRHETIEQSMHFIGNCLVEIAGETAFAETYCIIVQHERTAARSISSGRDAMVRTVMGVRYVDRFERRDGAWKIARRILVTEWIEEGMGTTDFGPAWTAALRSKDDAVYRIRDQD
ncbi:nuclear transport factor 2 family protein [Flavisphingomonas formosensis]|uniref:nuclear transport factor 2 family protein n=1 Tax=Flavisphingomonas formosensis TaxID=861534 RepID=UPI0012F788F5|nr:nuclear transport factor 2 family protein [Sphingomonas formosensis]